MSLTFYGDIWYTTYNKIYKMGFKIPILYQKKMFVHSFGEEQQSCSAKKDQKALLM